MCLSRDPNFDRSPPTGYIDVMGEKAKNPGAIKTLGAYIGSDDNCRAALEKKLADQETFFRRLKLAPPDVAGRLLRYCGVPRASFLARTHKPEVASAFLKDFDGLVTDAWCHLAEIAAPSQETLTLAHLPWDMGGCGFTRHLAIAKQAYAASSEAAFGISNVKQADRVRPVNEGYVEALKKLSPAAAHHVACTSEASLCGFVNRAIEHHERFPAAAVSAVYRHRLRAPHMQLADKKPRCPGCMEYFEPAAFNTHVTGCTHVHGFNASSRHMHVKSALVEMLQSAGVPCDSQEPREFGEYVCPGCNERFTSDAAATAHFVACTAVPPNKRRAGLKPRRSGPDGRAYFAEGSVVFDVTVVAPDAPSYIGKPLDAALNARLRDKQKKYGDAVTAAGEELVVLGATGYGALSDQSAHFLKRVAAASGGRFRACELREKFSCVAALMTGHVLYAAERRAGVVHASSLSSQAPQSSSRREAQTGADAEPRVNTVSVPTHTSSQAPQSSSRRENATSEQSAHAE
jgi:hypothetical protein